ncbi:MAG: glycosyltransferase, partial [candidate division Zixibacteria bacterium]|nr:glycosyltransferase [candidate division Zixibacteria bacterium]
VSRIPDDVKHYISISDFSQNILREYLPDDATVYDVANPVFVNQQESLDFNKRSNNFISIGRLTPEKGLFLLAEALRKANCNAIFVGDGECRGELEEKYPEIKITGWVSHEKVNEYIRAARALVLPSLWYETQGLVVAEAAANGVAAIVPDSSAARDMVIDRKTGQWFEGGSLDNLTKALINLNKPKTAAVMGQNAYDEFWIDPPTIEKHINRLNDVYQRILSSNVDSTIKQSSIESNQMTY